MQRWWGNLGSPHWAHVVTLGAAVFLWVRRMSRLDLDVFRLGTAMSNLLTYWNYME
jgi:hypothetical protein